MQVVLGSPRIHVVCFAGPFGVGKTTALRSVSDAPITTSDVVTTDLLPESAATKTTTTVGLEIGEWRAPDGDLVRVLGTPGQERFDDVRRETLRAADAVVLWLYGDHPDAVTECEDWLQQLVPDVTPDQLTVGVTRLGSFGELDRFRPIVDRLAPGTPLMAVDPRQRGDVARTLTVATFLPLTERSSA